MLRPGAVGALARVYASGGVRRCRCGREGAGLVEHGVGGQAVVHDADQPVKQVALGGVVSVACGAAAVIVGSTAGRGDQGGEGPDETGRRESLILDLPADA